MLRSAPVTRLLAAATLVAAGALALPPIHQAGAAPSPSATAALDWLADELAASDQVFGSTFGTDFFPDYGLTLDAVLALALGGDHDDAVDDAMDVLEPDLDHYFTDIDFGDGTGRDAGALAKSALTVILSGRDVNSSDGRDLEATLRAVVATTAPDIGRFSNSGAFGNNSNGFAQALGILALSHTDAGVPASAITFLLDQQCPGGGFRGAYDVSGGCTADASSDTDYTSIALMALLTTPEATGVDDAIDDAAAWLIDRQDDDGGFPNAFGDPNSNTAGLAANALRAAGRTAPADLGTAFVTGVQLTAAEDAADAGAIGFTAADHEAAADSGIDDFSRGQFRRATSQAVLAFGLPTYGLLPTPVATTTTTGASSTSTSGAPGASTSSSSTSTSLGATTSSTGAATSTTSSTTTVAAAAAAGGQLPRSGTEARAIGAVGLFVLGAGLMLVSRARARAAGA